MQNELVEYSYVLFNKSKIVFFPGSYTQLGAFYGSINQEPGQSLQDWYQELQAPDLQNGYSKTQKHLPSRALLVSKRETDTPPVRCVPYVLRSDSGHLPMADGNGQTVYLPSITVVYLLDTARIGELIRPSLPDHIGTYEILDSDGHLLYELDEGYDTYSNYQIVAGTLSYIHENGEKDGASVRTVLFDWLQDDLSDTVNMMPLSDPERFIILFFYDCDEKTARARIEAKMEALSGAISEKFTYPIYLSLNMIFESLQLAPKAYKDALETLAVFPSIHQDTLWSWSLTPESQSNALYYSSALEHNIIMQIHEGNYAEAERQLELILGENLNQRNISLGAYYQLMFSLKNFVFRLQQEFSPGTDPEELNISSCLYSKDLNQILSVLRRTMAFYCDLQKAQESQAIQDAVHIIGRDFSSPDMSVPYVAQQLHLSDNYFSQLFKEETGETFSAYLETVRLNHAVQLLQEDYRINDISKMCGYIAPKSFQRAFKRHFGTTASEYRLSFVTAEER